MADRQIDRDGWINRMIDRQTHGQTDKYNDRQTHTVDG